MKSQAVVDGTRNRRFSDNRAKRAWYAKHRNQRFAKRLNNA